MTRTRQIHLALAAFTCAAAAAPAALGAGEPKNEWPFTRPVGDSAAASSQSGNVAPSSQTGSGEAKNEAPFTRAVTAPVVVVRTNDGFDWADAGIGAGASIGLAAAALGAAALRAGARRPRATVA